MSAEAAEFALTRTSTATAPFRYAVIDLANAERLRPAVTGLRSSFAEPLLDRSFSPKLLQVGPWLVRLSKAPEVESALGTLAPGTPWGYYLYASFDLQSVRQALRRFNLVTLADASRPLLFRYWDPRVLEVFLNVAEPHQHAQFFEWIARVEDADGRFDARAD